MAWRLGLLVCVVTAACSEGGGSSADLAMPDLAVGASVDGGCGDGGRWDEDAGACVPSELGCDHDAGASLCCCEHSDALGKLICRGGEWTCDQPYQRYSGQLCLPICGSPCSWPCPIDMAGGG